MKIGIDASGSFQAEPGSAGFHCSAVAAATVPAVAMEAIADWTRGKLVEWERPGLKELHAQQMDWDQRREACEMLAARDDLHVATVVTSTEFLRSPGAVANHRARQLRLGEDALGRAKTEAGRERGERACRLLEGGQVGGSRLGDAEYVRAAMAPLAVLGAVQRAFCFYAGDEWLSEMGGFRLLIDRDTPSIIRYVGRTLLPTIGGDDRFRLTTPDHWREDPVHPLLAGAIHPDGDGYWVQRILDEEFEWPDSDEEPAVQVADIAAWVVCRTISHPEEEIARECFDLLRPLLVGEAGRCFDRFWLGDAQPSDDILDAYLHSPEQPQQWLTPIG